MPTASAIWLFALAAYILVVIPGPSVLYIVARGASQGPRAGVVSAAGVQTGSVVHVAAAVLGLSALISASATAFTIIKVLGGGYLIYLGVRAWRSAGQPAVGVRSSAARSLWRIYRDGIIVNALNPKTAVFFLAFLPQFVDAERGSVTGQLLIFGLVFVIVGLTSDGLYGVVAGVLGDRVRQRTNRPAGKVSGRAAGVLYLGLGAITLAAGNHA